MSIEFDPAVQRGKFTCVVGGWDDALITKAKESLRAEMEGFIPPRLRKRVIWIVTPPGVPGMPGTVAWKYTPARKVAAYERAKEELRPGYLPRAAERASER